VKAAARVVARAALGSALLATASAEAQSINTAVSNPPISTTVSNPPRIRVIEWSLPADQTSPDARPGAIVVDTQGHDVNRMWFVTRIQPHLYRLDFPRSFMKGTARWTSWELKALTSGGIRRLRPSWDRRYVFIRTISSDGNEAIERVDTDPTKCPGANCQTTVYQDNATLALDVSDVAVDDRNNVYTSHSPNLDPGQSYIQRLTPGTGTAAAQVTRWQIPGSGAGLCGGDGGTLDQITENSPCISGIAVHPGNRNLVYFSEPSTNSIGELNVSSNPPTVRHWSLDALNVGCMGESCNPVMGPRQLQIDKRGKVWVVTGSGNLVSLDPCSNRMTKHEMPDGVFANPFGIAPDDDVVGYTAPGNSQINKVGMLVPKGNSICVTPKPVCVTKTTICNFPAQTLPSACNSGTVCPTGKTVLGQVTRKDDGTFVEARVDSNVDNYGNPDTSPNPDRSLNPLGITPVKWKGQGAFFVAIGDQSTMGIDRVAFVRLPILKEKLKHPRDEDDENDGADGDHGWHGWHGHADNDDDDDDGIDNEHDQHKHERDSRENDADDDGQLNGGGSKDYTMVATPTSLALVAMTTASDPLAQIGVDILDSMGMLVARSLPTPGLASVVVALPLPGTYTCRIRNYGATPIGHTPNLLVREPWDQ